MLNMKSLSVLQKTKLNSVVKLTKQLKSILCETGLSHQEIQQFLAQIINTTFQMNRKQELIKSQDSLNKYMILLIASNNNQNILTKLKRLQVALYMQKNAVINGSQAEGISRKTSQVISQKVKKQKKQKKEKKKNNQNKKNMFKADNTQNLTKQPQSQLQINIFNKNQIPNIFKLNAPLQQSTLFNPNIFAMTENGENFFKKTENLQNNQKQDLRKNLWQIQMFKQFVEKQMMAQLLSQQNDANETFDFTNMGNLMFGR